MVTRLQDNFVGPWGDSVQADARSYGTEFTLGADMTVTEVGFYRLATGATYACADMAVWDTGATGTPVIHPVALADNGAAGWQRTALATPFSLLSGHTYRLCGLWLQGWHAPYVTGSSRPTAITNVTWPTNTRYYSAPTATLIYPTNGDTAVFYGMDLTFDSTVTAGASPALTTAGMDTVVSSYVGSNYSDHPTSAVSLIKTSVDSIKTTVEASGSIIDRLDGLSDDAITWLNDRSADAVNLLNEASAAWLAFLNNGSSRITGSGDGGGTAFYGPAGVQVADGVEQLLAQATPASTFPGTGWAMTDEQDWTDALAYAEPADLYVVDVYTYASGLSATTWDGVDLIYRLGSWAILQGSYLQPRRYFEFLSNHLVDGGRRMQGVLVALPRGGTGHIQAWQYTP